VIAVEGCSGGGGGAAAAAGDDDFNDDSIDDIVSVVFVTILAHGPGVTCYTL